jgi:D-tyrosyl-tRNA(Tyr) deacylase
MRIFPDEGRRMNRSLLEVGGAALVVSQFTLFGDLRRGHRPSFVSAASPEPGRSLCGSFAKELRSLGVECVREGSFGAHMLVEAANDGPVTIVASLDEPPWEAACG